MTFDFPIDQLSTYLLVFCRIAGMIAFNPLLSRKNILPQFKIALVLGITILITPGLMEQAPANPTDFVFIWMMTKELFVGFACGFVFQIYYHLLFTAGDIIDMGFGLSMAKAFDPGTNIQISMTGNIFQMVFVLYLFATNCHLVLIELMVSSYDMVSIGAVTIGADVGRFIMTLFSSAFLLVMQLSLPFIAAAFILEIAMGILMKLIPQINVFVIHFQFKIILGFILLFVFAEPTSMFLREYINTMFLSMKDVFGVV